MVIENQPSKRPGLRRCADPALTVFSVSCICSDDMITWVLIFFPTNVRVMIWLTKWREIMHARFPSMWEEQNEYLISAVLPPWVKNCQKETTINACWNFSWLWRTLWKRAGSAEPVQELPLTLNSSGIHCGHWRSLLEGIWPELKDELCPCCAIMLFLSRWRTLINNWYVLP